MLDALVALAAVYQAHAASAPELRPIAAQLLRCVHLMIEDDPTMRDACQRLGLVELLVAQLHLDVHGSMGEPAPHHGSAAFAVAAAASSLVGGHHRPASPSPSRSPPPRAGTILAQPVPPDAGTLPPQVVPDGSPLYRSGGSGSGGSSPHAPCGGGRRPPSCPMLEPPIPEEQEVLQDPLATAPVLALVPRSGDADATPGSEAAPLRGLGMGPTPLQRAAAACLLRAVLAPVASRATIEVVVHGALLPALHMQVRRAVSAAF